MSAFDRLLEQIDAFIRKYYKNEMLKGALIVVSFLLASWLLVSILEFFGRFSSGVRLVLLLAFILGNTYFIGRYFVLPVMRLYSFGKRINRTQAARIIGSFFPSVSDRLLNTLQLNEFNNPNDRTFELIRASVVQRSNDLVAVNFVDAVRYSESKRFLRFAIPIALLFLGIAIVAPALITKGSSNVVNFNRAQEAPFEFTLVSSTSRIDEGEALSVAVDVSGLYVPENVFIVSDRGRFLMKKSRKNRLEYMFENMKEGMSFHFESEGFSSKNYSVDVVGKSSIGRLVADVKYPSYLNRKNEVLTNIADIDIPEGTQITWNVEARNVKGIRVLWNDSIRDYKTDFVSFKKKYKSSGNLSFVLNNATTQKRDTSIVEISVTKDAYPSILVSETVDSLRAGVRAFSGLVSDDYGLSGLTFVYSITKKSGAQVTRKVPVRSLKGTNDKFVFAVDFSRENLSVEDKISYHFVVTDNDGVNGSKATSSQTFVYELPSLEQLNEKRDDTQKELQSALSDVLKRTEEFQKDVNKLQKSMMNKSKSDFRSMEQVQNLKQEQQALQDDLEEIKDKLSESNDEKNKLSEQDEELLKQQELIDQLMEQVMDDELKKLLDELEKMMQKQDQQMQEQNVEKLEQSSEEMKKKLDRTLEMLKRLQVNEKIDDVKKELDALSEEQEKLKVAEDDKKISSEDAEKKQDEINKKFDEIKKDIEELDKLNKELSRPMNLSDKEEAEKAIEKELQEAKEKLSKGKDSKAGENQKSAAEQMKDLAKQMENEQAESNKKQEEEDMGLIRLLLENLMSLSFDEELNLNGFSKVKDTDPNYRRLGRKQRSIIDDTKVVEDSLIALAKRQPKISSFIDRELTDIRSNFSLLVDEIDEHKRREIGQHQQLVMTSYNNLALMLNESLQSMQQQQQQQKPGNGSCDNPGGSGKKPSSGKGEMESEDMKEMLKKQLEQMKKGPNPGGKEPGNKPGKEGQGMPGLGNKEIAKMAAQQTAIRQRLEQMKNDLNKEGQGKGNQLNPLLKELEQQEKDLINKSFSPEMIRRQQDILTRLLESEKAMKERGFEEKRESKSGKEVNYGNLIRFDEYNRQKLGQIELLRAVDPLLSKYYKDKAGEYFNRAE